MSKHRGVEKRLFDAVVLVLASSAGCYVMPPPQPQRQAPPPSPSEATRDTWSRPPPDDPPNDPPRSPPPNPVANAEQICATHKRTPLDASKIPPVPSTPVGRGVATNESAAWNAKANVAVCTIVRDRRTTSVDVTYTPRCCPSPGVTQQPCPGPHTVTEQTATLLVERAHLTPDGTVLTSHVAWATIEPDREPQPYCGRLPEGARVLGAPDHGDQLSHALATMAELEAASIPAFDRLARELAAHGAPAKLVHRAYAAMRDEVRHARAIGALAVHHGASPRPISVTELACRSLVAIALENAIEGCVREAYGALVATYQAERAPAHLRPVFRAVARDERRHAALAEDVHAWIMARLDVAERAEVQVARARAEAELRTHLPAMPACAELGMPTTPHALALFDSYFALPGSMKVVEQPQPPGARHAEVVSSPP